MRHATHLTFAVLLATCLASAGELQSQQTGRSSSPLTLYRAEFVIYTGRPGHEGLFPIQGQPVVGDRHTLSVTMFGDYDTIEFRLVSQAGKTLAVPDLKKGDPRGDINDFVGEVELPKEPFRVMAVGTTPEGQPFQRVYAHLFTPQTVGVNFSRIGAPFRPGEGLPIGVRVRNVGALATFRVKAVLTSDDGHVKEYEPQEVTIRTAETKNLEFTLEVPPNIKPDAQVMVVVAATDVDNPSVTNSALLRGEIDWRLRQH